MATVKDTMNALKAQSSSAPARTQGKSIKDWVKTMEPQIAKALPSVITPERFSRMVLTAISTTPKLAQCTPSSFCGAMMQAAQLGLEPNTPLGQSYLIPYGNTCTFVIGYKGLIDLAHRSGEFQTIYAETVYENDDFDYELGLEPKLTHKPAKSNRGEPVFYYAVYKLTNGGWGFEVMSREDVEKHARKFSKAYSSGPWRDNFDEMAKKTVLKKVLKYAPIRTDFARGVASDESVLEAKEDDDQMIILQEQKDYSVDEETGEVEEKEAKSE